MDAGIRVFPGVFIEGGWERHDDNDLFGTRWNAGLAFRFSLPDFKGANYGDGSMSSNLYQIVEREKRILYEERVAGPTASLVRTGIGVLQEGSMASVQVQLSEALEEDVILNLVGSGTATYGTSADYEVSVGDMNCGTVNMNDCQVTIPTGSTSTDVEISISEDGRGESSETIILSIEVASAGDTGLTLGNSRLVLAIAEDPPLPIARLVYSGSTTIREAAETRMTIELDEALPDAATLNLVVSPAQPILRFQVLQAGETPDTSTALFSTPCVAGTCEITVPAGSTVVDVQMSVLVLLPGSEYTISVDVDSGSASLVQVGSPSSLVFTIPPPTISFDSDAQTAIEGDDATNAQTTATLSITPPPASDVVIPYTVGGDGIENTDYLLSFRATSGAASVSADGLTYPANATGVVFTIAARDDNDRMDETVVITINDGAANFPAGYEIGDHRMVTITLDDTTP